MSDFKEILKEVSDKLIEVHYDNGDLGDVGNEIGIVIAKWIDNKKMGYELDDFISGLKHGISLIDGTHP